MDQRYKPSSRHVYETIGPIFVVFALLLFLSVLHVASIPSLRLIGFAALLLVFAFTGALWLTHLLKTGRISPLIGGPQLLLNAFLAINIFGMLVTGLTEQSITVVAQLGMLIGFFGFCSVWKWRRNQITVLASYAGMLYVLNLLSILIKPMGGYFSGLFLHKNVLAALVYYSGYFVLSALLNTVSWSGKAVWGAFLMLGLCLIALSESRSVWLAIFVCSITWFGWRVLIRTRRLYMGVFWINGLIIALFCIIYPLLTRFRYASLWNATVARYTGANLFSGREYLWSEILTIIRSKPWGGFGPGTLPQDFITTTHSSHNLYLQLTLQTGLIGVFTVGLALWTIWRIYWLGRSSSQTRLSAAFLLSIMVHQLFEVTLTQNVVVVGLMQWLVIGIGLSSTAETMALARRGGVSQIESSVSGSPGVNTHYSVGK